MAKTSKIVQQLIISAVCLVVLSLSIFLFLTFYYKSYDYNLTMRFLAIVPCVIGSIIISLEYITKFNEHYTKKDVLYLRQGGWQKTALVLFIVVFIIEVLAALVLGLCFDRNNNMLRFLLDSSHSGLIVIIANIVTSLVVMLVQRIPCQK